MRILLTNDDGVYAPGLRAMRKELQKLGDVEQAEMDKVFNNGIGFVMIVSSFYAESIQRQLNEQGLPSYVIGEVRDGDAEVEWV